MRGRPARRAKQLKVRDDARHKRQQPALYGIPPQIAKVVELVDDMPQGTYAVANVLGEDIASPTSVGTQITVGNPIGEDYVTGDRLVVMWCEYAGVSGIWIPTCCGEGGGTGEQYPCTWCQAETTPNFFSVTIAGVQTISESLGPGFSIVPLASQQEARDWLNSTRRVPRLGTSPCIFEVTEQLATDGTNIKMRVELLQTGVQVRADVIGGPPDFWEGLSPDTSPYVGTGQRVPAETAHSTEDSTSYVSFDGVATVDINGTFA